MINRVKVVIKHNLQVYKKINKGRVPDYCEIWPVTCVGKTVL